MDPASTLLSLCEVAVSIAGFAGIPFAISSRGSTEDDLMRRWRLRFMVAASIGAVGFSSLPLSLRAPPSPDAAATRRCRFTGRAERRSFQPANEISLALVRRLGFRREGSLRAT